MSQKRADLPKKQRTRKKTIWLRILAAILLVFGIALIFNVPIRDFMVRQNQAAVYKKLSAKAIEKNRKKAGNYDFAKVQAVDIAQVTKARIKNTANAVGALAIPAVRMYLPILLGLSNDSLSTGGGTMRPDQVMGKNNYPLAGHYMTANGVLFSPLENTQIGEKVYLTDLKKVYVYKIYYKQVVPPTAVWLVKKTKKKIVTLLTCADGGINRWAIRGNLIKVEKATDLNLKVFKLK